MKFFWRKTIIFLIFFAVIFNVNSHFGLNMAEAAALPVICLNCSQVVVQAAWKISDIGRWLKEDLMKSLRDVIAKRIIDYIVDQTVQWIQGGGKPQFVTDWKGFLKKAGDIAFDQVIKDVGLARLCEPFSLQVRISLLPVQGFSTRISCTLDSVVKNIEDFYKNFENGGWIAYNEAWQPQNNYFGQMLMIHDQILTETSKEVTAQANDALAGKGFLSVKKCIAWQTPLDPQTGQPSGERKCVREEIVTPGDTVGVAVGNAITSDTQWAANIQSWTSALVNALINRLITEGVGLMGGSGTGGGSSYYPPEYQDVRIEEQKQQDQQMIAEVQKFTKEWQYLYDAKSKSLSYSQQELVILNNLRSRNCQPPVSDAEIQNTQADINRLQTEVNALKAKIDEANKLIAQIKDVGTSTRERALAQQAYNAFINKYNTSEVQEQIISGSARNEAVAETEAKRNELQDAQGRMNMCLAMP